jgi:hypothetical protein
LANEAILAMHPDFNNHDDPHHGYSPWGSDEAILRLATDETHIGNLTFPDRARSAND